MKKAGRAHSLNLSARMLRDFRLPAPESIDLRDEEQQQPAKRTAPAASGRRTR